MPLQYFKIVVMITSYHTLRECGIRIRTIKLVQRDPFVTKIKLMGAKTFTKIERTNSREISLTLA